MTIRQKGALAAGIAGLAYAAGSALAAARLARPRRRFAYGISPSLYGLEAQDVEFPARGGAPRISAWYIPHPGSRRAVVMAHGKDVSRAMEFAGRALEIAQALHRQGFSLLMIDLRGHGMSGPGVYSFGRQERDDVNGAVDWLQGQGYAPGCVGVLGVSLGSSACLGAAAENETIGAVVSDSGFAAILPLIQANWGSESGLPDWMLPGVLRAARLLYGVDLAASRPADEVGRIRGALLLIHGDQDRLVPPAHAAQLHAAAPGSQLWMVPGAIHAGCYGIGPGEYLRRVGAFFDEHLGK